MPIIFRWICFAGLCLILFGCGNSPLTIVLTADPKLNPNTVGTSMPVAVTLYQLQDPDSFQMATFNQFLNEDLSSVANSVVAKRRLTLAPKQVKTVPWQRDPRAQYLGITVMYRRHNGHHWQTVRKLPPSFITDVVSLKFNLRQQKVRVV